MKLLVLAHTPPPLHGQSVMVQAMLEGLARRPCLELVHVNSRLSQDNADIGQWRPSKIFRTLRFALQAIAAGRRHGCDTLYYVPAPPGKRGALYRDWLVMLLCRPFFRRLVLHWHAVGLGGWLEREAGRIERTVTCALLGRADLSIALAESLQPDADVLRPRRRAVVPNGIADPRPPRPARSNASFQALFLGLCTEDKGVFAAAHAIVAANQRGKTRFNLVAAGPFADEASRARFDRLVQAHPGVLEHAGFVTGEEKTRLLLSSHCLLFPTHYAAEALPLVVLEAFAHDLPVVATHWRGLPDLVTPDCGRLVAPQDVEALTQALLAVQQTPPHVGACRARFEREFTLPQHLDRLAAALQSVAAPE